MASIFRKPKSPYYFAAFRDAAGCRCQRSTKSANRTTALDTARAWEKAAKSGREGRLTEGQCRRVLSELLETATGEALHFHTCRAWFEEWLAGKVGATAKSTFSRYKQISEEFLTHLGPRASLPLNAISQKDVRRFRDDLVKEGHSPTTTNQTVRKVLSSIFGAALRMGYVTVNPCAGVEALKDNAEVEKDVFTHEQVLALLEAAVGNWKGAILAGYFTGLRLRDVTELRWEAIDLGAGVLRLKTRKTGSVIMMPLSSDLATWLSAQPRGIGKAPVFPELAGKAGSGRGGLSMQFKAIMKKAGIVGRMLRHQQENSAGRAHSSLSFHSLRHSFNSALANAGVSQEVRMKLTGHSSAEMNKGYTHHDLEPLRAAIGKLPVMGGASA